MDDVLLSQIEEPFENILDDGKCLLLLELTLLSKARVEVTLSAEFGNYIAVSVAGEDLVAAEDVGVVQLLQYLDLGEKEFF